MNYIFSLSHWINASLKTLQKFPLTYRRKQTIYHNTEETRDQKQLVNRKETKIFLIRAVIRKRTAIIFVKKIKRKGIIVSFSKHLIDIN